ncbi:MAG TPA: MoxR family ATPase [Gemmataceae bacterium]|jgi:MoxR-like ATPase|nr:MoxR family ATPase [Gemmataceae bacterium]
MHTGSERTIMSAQFAVEAGRGGEAAVTPHTHDGQLPETAALLERLRVNIAGVLLGKPEVIEMALVTLLADGHLLIEDVPGIGKTLLAKALARSLDCSFHRIQFTPDLLPSDLIGTSVFHQPSGDFVFKPGPLFAHVVLADEINRATPRTQSALLEAMSDRQVSVDGQTRPLDPPFLVLATQNPYEFEGTYLLPESQLDRFLMRLQIGYPGRAAEKEILTCHRAGEPIDRLGPVLSAADVGALQRRVRQVRVDDSLNDYILDLADATRNHPDLYLGASPRASLSLYRAAQALALVKGRDYVVPDDIKWLAPAVLTHRLLTKGIRQGERSQSAADIVAEILDRTAVPV